MSDSSAVDAAVVAKLASDATLMAILTDGVYFDVAEPLKTKFAIVSQQDHEDTHSQSGPTMEEFTYLVKAVVLGSGGTDAKNAAARIQTLLSDGSLTITGYTLMWMRREGRIRYTEVDDQNEGRRWQHRGGLYHVQVAVS